MNAAIAQVPVPGSALRISGAAFPPRGSDNAVAHIRVRRQIGKRTTVCVTTFLGAMLSVAALGIGASVDMPRTLMSPADFTQLKKAIEAETRLALAGCREAVGSDRDLCKVKARAEERVKRADLGARYHGTVTAQDEARTARTRASYDLARAHCDARIDEERIDCLRAARDDRNNLLDASKLASN